jgi:cyclophilin family peptidyl-prolyl cis-trans isomerase
MARTSDRRQRQLARQKAQTAATARQQKARRRTRIAAGGVAVVVVLSTLGAFLGSRSSTSNSSTPTSTVPTSTTLPKSGITPPAVALGATLTGATPCPAEDGSSARTTTFETAPPNCIDNTHFYTATITTTKGVLTVQLNPKVSPQTVNTFVVLARYHYYDGQPITDVRRRASFTAGMTFIDGSTQPGFAIPGEIPEKGSVFTPGALSMAPASASNGIGGQLVFATFDQAADNNQRVTPLGIMLSGDTTLTAINQLASESGKPTALAAITSISVVRSGAIPS